ncbi:hypothetical protein LCGC14_0393160 [marine sediment metagenome]|uniref:Rubredoxin-like domain-containing protein n=1 Tax=marine sediment metagenome TaxID=412755 RepID=A0A0F9SZ45_9ZZZZ
MIVKCKDCNWQGDDSELVTKYYANPHEPHDAVPEAVCPVCGNVWIDEVETTSG